MHRTKQNICGECFLAAVVIVVWLLLHCRRCFIRWSVLCVLRPGLMKCLHCRARKEVRCLIDLSAWLPDGALPEWRQCQTMSSPPHRRRLALGPLVSRPSLGLPLPPSDRPGLHWQLVLRRLYNCLRQGSSQKSIGVWDFGGFTLILGLFLCIFMTLKHEEMDLFRGLNLETP